MESMRKPLTLNQIYDIFEDRIRFLCYVERKFQGEMHLCKALLIDQKDLFENPWPRSLIYDTLTGLHYDPDMYNKSWRVWHMPPPSDHEMYLESWDTDDGMPLIHGCTAKMDMV